MSNRLHSFPQTILPEVCILLIAMLTRFWRLSYHSIWFDEAVSLRWAGSPPFNIQLSYMIPTTFQLVEEKHPPVYYSLLFGWRELMNLFGLGQNDAALRALGALLGIFTVLGVLLLVRKISGRATACWTALFVALSPVLVWYSQELRMFQPAVTFVVWGLFGLLSAWASSVWWQRIGWWLLTVVAFEFALYGYLFSAFVLPAAGATLVLLWCIGIETSGAHEPLYDRLRRNARLFGEGAIVLVITGGLFIPLAQNAWLVNSNESTPGAAFGNFWPTTIRLFEIFTFWREQWATPWDSLALLAVALLILLGLFRSMAPWAMNRHRLGALLILIWVCLPWILGNVLLARNASVFKEDRYHIYLVPFVLWGIGLGVVQLSRFRQWAAWLAGGVIALLFVSILPRFWTPELLREDWRSAASYIDAYQQASPALPSAGVAHINYTHQPMDWYLQQKYPFDELPIFGLFGTPLSLDMIDTVVAPPLNGIVDYGAKTLWLTQSHLDGVDDGGIVEGWLRENFPIVTEQYPAGVKLTGFALQTQFEQLPPLPDSVEMVNTSIAPGITLVACEVMTPILSARDERYHAPSGWVHLRLWWTTTKSVTADYSLIAQVADQNGVWGTLLEREGEAFSHFPTTRWEQGKLIRTEADVNLNPETANGEYEISVGLEGGSLDERNPKVSCGNVTIRNK